MILSIQKFSASFTRTEALKIHKYLHPSNFLWVATDPRMIQASKSFILFFQEACQVASPGPASIKDPMQLNATMAMHYEMPPS
jgi:hypothetical protein